MFPVIRDKDFLAKNLDNHLNWISNWAVQWKMIFNPDINNNAQGDFFSHKILKLAYLPLILNNSIKIPINRSEVFRNGFGN